MGKLFLGSMLSFLCSGIAYAGLFGPSNYDECVLDGVKDAKTDMAARLVAQACRNKFPVKSDPVEQRRWIEVGFYKIGSTGLRNRLADKLSILEITSAKDVYGSRVSKVKVMNGYTFPVHNISMGIVKKSEKSKYCPMNVSSYSEIVQCSGTAEGYKSGSFSCPPINAAACVTSFYADMGNVTEKAAVNAVKSETGEP